MRIAYLAWGSLLWNDKKLKLKSGWEKTNFQFPLNFSRISDKGKGRLTLVIDPENGFLNPVYFGITKSTDLNKAINTLKNREKTSMALIGYINLKDGTVRSNLLEDKDIKKVMNFGKNQKLDAIVWTDIPPNFKEVTGKNYSKEEALKYIDSRKSNTKVYNKILEYIFLSKIYGKINTNLSKYVISKLMCNL